ncbi:MAG: hypothetical protein AAF585_20445 [Verrucomicrobiota bacterium]
MKLDDIKSVLSFSAFRPDPDDCTATIAKRMLGKRYLMINVSRNEVSWKSVDRKGGFGPGGVQEGEFSVVAHQMADEWVSMTDGGWCVLSINNRFIITLESNMSRRPDSEAVIRSNPRSVIGAKHDRSKRYAIHHNPETSASLLLATDESMVKTAEDTLVDIGLKPARISSGLFAMVEDYVHREHSARGAAGGSGRDFVLIACCAGSVCLLSQRRGQWSELRCRSGIYSGGDIEPVMNIATPMLNGAESGSGIILLHDQPGTRFAQALHERLQPFGAVDMTQPEHIWMVLSQN